MQAFLKKKQNRQVAGGLMLFKIQKSQPIQNHQNR